VPRPEGPGFSCESESFLVEVFGFSLLRFARVDVQNEFQESVIIEVHELTWFIDLYAGGGDSECTLSCGSYYETQQGKTCEQKFVCGTLGSLQ